MDLKELKDTQSLVDDIEDFINNPKFNPTNQNKWFFSDGLSYYQQLCEILKTLTYFQESFKLVYENEKTIANAYEEVATLPEEFKTLSSKVDTIAEQVSSEIARIETLESDNEQNKKDIVALQVDDGTMKSDITNLKADNTQNKNDIVSLKADNDTNKNNISALQEDNTTNKANISTLQEDNTTNKANISALQSDNTTNKEDIATLKADNSTNKENINTNTNNITALQEADFLKLVGFLNSENVSVIDHGKVDGKQTFTISVTGTTPVNLTKNISYFNDNSTQTIATACDLILDSANNTIKLTLNNFSDGVSGSTESTIKLSTDEFKILNNQIMLVKDYATTTALEEGLANKQDTLVSGSSIKTINNQDVLGSGNVDIEALPIGGVKGNLLYKKSETDGDVGWTGITTDNLLTQDNIINHLNSSSTTNVLGASQGKVLNDKFSITKYSNIEISLTPSALSDYQTWDTSKAYGYSADIVISGITANSLIQNIIMTDTLLSAIAPVITTGSDKLTIYTSSADTLSGTIISLYTQEVE